MFRLLREWISPATCLWVIKEVLNDQDLLSSHTFHIVPVLNPDGYVYSWVYSRMWRKNRSPSSTSWGARCQGVDLNRNFDASFGTRGSSASPCAEDYAGRAANSELETKAWSNYVKRLSQRVQIAAYFSIHSFTQLWMYPYGYKQDRAVGYEKLNEISRAATEAIRKRHGQTYRYGPIWQTIRYRVSGSSADWAFDELKINAAFAVELRDRGQQGFLLRKEFIKPTGEEFFAAVQAVLKMT